MHAPQAIALGFQQALQSALSVRLDSAIRAEPRFRGDQNPQTILATIIGAEPTVNPRRWVAGASHLLRQAFEISSGIAPPEVEAALIAWEKTDANFNAKRVHIDPMHRLIEGALLLHLNPESPAPADSDRPLLSRSTPSLRVKPARIPFTGPLPDKGLAILKRVTALNFTHPEELIPGLREAIENETSPMAVVRLLGGDGLGNFILSNSAFHAFRWDPIPLSQTPLRSFFHLSEVMRIAIKIALISRTDNGIFSPEEIHFKKGNGTFFKTVAGGIVRRYRWGIPESKDVDGFYGIGVLTDLKEP